MRSGLLDAPHTSVSAAGADPIRPGMQVCDRYGDPVGTVAAVHRDVLGEIAGDPLEAVVEIKTGLLGLGPRYYVPYSAFRAAGHDGAILTKGRDELDPLGFDRKPEFVE